MSRSSQTAAGGTESYRRPEILELLFDSVNDAIFVLDDGGNFLDVNRTAVERLGYTRAEMLSMNVAEIDPPEFAARVPSRLREIGVKGKAVFESAHRRRDGTVIPVEINARTVELQGRQVVLSVIRDITRRKAAERELKASETHVRMLFDAIGDGIFIHDMEGRFLDANRSAHERLGYTKEELLGKKVLDIDHPDCSAEMSRTLKELREAGRVVFESVHVGKDGASFPVEISSRFIDFLGQEAVMSIARDITERKEAERALAQYTEKLVHMNHLKQLFTDILSHDLLNPASIVLNVTNTLAQKSHPRDHEEVEMILRNARRIVRLIRDSSTYARVESAEALEKNEQDLGELLERNLKSCRPKFDARGMRILFDRTPGAVVPVNTMIGEVFLNLLDNAAKYAPEGSEVEVSVVREGTEWVVTVADQGDGVPDEFKEAIFERFGRQEKGGVQGSGLGLAIAKRITELHGGRIWVEDNPGGGSRFKFSLPVPGAPQV